MPTGPKFGWVNNSSPYIDAANLEAMYTGSYRCNVVTPEEYGATRNGTLVTGVTTVGGAVTGLGANWSSGDVGKVFAVANPSSGATTVTTITGVSSSTTCGLAASPGTIATGTFAVYGTDDTSAFNSALSAGDALGRADGSYHYQLWLTDGIYVLNGSLVNGSPYYGNAQIPIPINGGNQDTSSMQVEIIGTCDVGGIQFWDSPTPAFMGATLFSTLKPSTTLDGTNGPASVIGGPTPEQGYGDEGGDIWGNCCVRLDGINIVIPYNPSICGVDMVGMAQCVVGDRGLAVSPFTNNTIINAGTPYWKGNGGWTTTWQFGFRQPQTNNNAYNPCQKFLAQGCVYGMVVGEHSENGFIYSEECTYGILPSAVNHGATIRHLLIQDCLYGIETATFADSTGGGRPLNVLLFDMEDVVDYYIDDSADALYGICNIRYVNTAVPSSKINGAANYKIIDCTRVPGVFSASNPVNNTNATILYRDAVVIIEPSGATISAITVNGTATGLTSGTVVVPSGQTIQISFSGGTPTWVWYLL